MTIRDEQTQREKMRKFLAEKSVERDFGFLQFFAGEGGTDNPGGEGGQAGTEPGQSGQAGQGEEGGTDNPGGTEDNSYIPGALDPLVESGSVTFDQLLKDNPKLKAQYTSRFNASMSARLKKFEGVDVEEYKELKQRAESGNLEGDAEVWKTKHDNLKAEMETLSKKQAVQTFALDKSFNREQATLISSLINLNKLSADDQGEWDGIHDEVERITAQFPTLFTEQPSDNQTNKGDQDKYFPGTQKTSGGGKKLSPEELGRKKAEERNARRKGVK